MCCSTPRTSSMASDIIHILIRYPRIIRLTDNVTRPCQDQPRTQALFFSEETAWVRGCAKIWILPPKSDSRRESWTICLTTDRGNRTYDLWNARSFICQLSHEARSIWAPDIPELLSLVPSISPFLKCNHVTTRICLIVLHRSQRYWYRIGIDILVDIFKIIRYAK